MSRQTPKLPTKVRPAPDYTQFNKRVSRRFSDWFDAERARSGLTARGLLDQMALLYVIKATENRVHVASWKVEP